MSNLPAVIKYVVIFKPWTNKEQIEIRGDSIHTAEEKYRILIDAWNNDRVVQIHGAGHASDSIMSIEPVVVPPPKQTLSELYPEMSPEERAKARKVWEEKSGELKAKLSMGGKRD